MIEMWSAAGDGMVYSASDKPVAEALHPARSVVVRVSGGSGEAKPAVVVVDGARASYQVCILAESWAVDLENNAVSSRCGSALDMRGLMALRAWLLDADDVGPFKELLSYIDWEVEAIQAAERSPSDPNLVAASPEPSSGLAPGKLTTLQKGQVEHRVLPLPSPMSSVSSYVPSIEQPSLQRHKPCSMPLRRQKDSFALQAARARCVSAGEGALSLDFTQLVEQENAFAPEERTARSESDICSQIRPYLYVGGEKVARDKAKLQACGITHIFNMVRNTTPNFFEHDGSFAYGQAFCDDAPDEDIASTVLFVSKFIEDARREGGICFVHCRSGISRSASAVIAHLILREGLAFEAAFMQVQQKRQVVDPNGGFLDQLKDIERWAESTMETPRLFRVSLQRPDRRDAPFIGRCEPLALETLDHRFSYVLEKSGVVLLAHGPASPCSVREAGIQVADIYSDQQNHVHQRRERDTICAVQELPWDSFTKAVDAEGSARFCLDAERPDLGDEWSVVQSIGM